MAKTNIFSHTGMTQTTAMRKPAIHIHPAMIHQLLFLLTSRVTATRTVYSTATWINNMKAIMQDLKGSQWWL
jgi:hypothetical protein